VSPLVAAELHGSAPRARDVLTREALAFVLDLHELFGPRRQELLEARAERRARIAAG